MLGPHSMPIGFTYDGDPLYAAPPVAAGGRQPLAVLADGELVFPAPSDVVPVGQPQPFGVLASGTFVWALEQRPADPPVPWYRRRLAVPAAALVAALAVGVAAAAGGGAERQPAAPAGADGEAAGDRQTAERRAAEREAAEREAAQRAAADQEQEQGPAPDADGPRLDFLMPDLIGGNLQDAQDEVQALGVFFSLSDDLRGTRSQVRDANWQVCTQSPAAGTRVRGDADDWEGRISFGVVRLEETCP